MKTVKILMYVIILCDVIAKKYWFRLSYKIRKNLRLEDSSSGLYILAVKESFFEDEHNFLFCKDPCFSELLISFNCMRIVGLVTTYTKCPKIYICVASSPFFYVQCNFCIILCVFISIGTTLFSSNELFSITCDIKTISHCRFL